MHKVLFFNGQNEQVANIFSGKAPKGFDVSWRPDHLNHNEKAALIQDVEFLVLFPAVLSGSVLREAKSLRLIQLLTAGYDKIDLTLTAKLGIPVATNGGANSWAVAEHCIGLLLGLYKRLIPCDQSMRQAKWGQAVSGFNTFEVAGKTVGLIGGAGNIGRKVARRLKPFETRILYYDEQSAPDIEKEMDARKVSLDELLRESDIISIHIPLFRTTRSLIGDREFSLMKPTAVLLNTSRGPIVDEKALVA
ncbi:MAG: NAD(P)-dependent oxidoreductase, partial [Syntrophales bacterium]